MLTHLWYGPRTPPSLITVQSILSSGLVSPAPADGFAYLLAAVRADLYQQNGRLVTAGKVFSGILGLLLVLSLGGFLFRLLFRADRSFYKLLPTPRGTFIMPNVIQIWLLANIFYALFSFPFLWRQVLVGSGSLYSSQIFIALTWIAVFSGLWNVAWGTAVSAQLATSTLNSADGQAIGCGRPLFVPPWILNLYFPLVWVTGVGVMAGTFGGTTRTWNRGARAWGALQAKLVAAEAANGGQAGGADAVLGVVPDANDRLATMTRAFWTFQMPWIVCLAFSAITAATMILSAAIQLRTLFEQIRLINADLRAADRPLSINGPPPSLSSARTNALQRKAGLKSVLSKVILTTLALSLSMLGYLASCIVGQTNSDRTPLFMRYKSPRTHVYALTFVYSALGLVVVILILLQTLDPTVLQTKVESSQRRSSGLDGAPDSPITPGVTKRPLSSSGGAAPSSSAEYGPNPFKESFELAQGPPTASWFPSTGAAHSGSGQAGPAGPGPGQGAYSPPLTPSTPARLTRDRRREGTGSQDTHYSCERFHGRKPVPEV